MMTDRDDAAAHARGPERLRDDDVAEQQAQYSGAVGAGEHRRRPASGRRARRDTRRRTIRSQ